MSTAQPEPGAVVVGFDPASRRWVTATDRVSLDAVPMLEGALRLDPTIRAAAARDEGNIVRRQPGFLRATMAWTDSRPGAQQPSEAPAPSGQPANATPPNSGHTRASRHPGAVQPEAAVCPRQPLAIGVDRGRSAPFPVGRGPFWCSVWGCGRTGPHGEVSGSAW